MPFDYANATRGALGGAAAGAPLGPFGVAGGGLLGGVLGGLGGSGQPDVQAPTANSYYNLPKFRPQYQEFTNVYNQAGKRQAPRLNDSRYSAQQLSYIRQLQREAQGRGIAQQLVRDQAQRQADQVLQQQVALQQAAAPGGGAMAARNAALAGARAQSAVGGQAAQAAGQAQLGSLNLLGGTLQNARQTDIGLHAAQAANSLQAQQQNDQLRLEALRQRLLAAQMQQQGGLDFNRNVASYNNALLGRAQQPSVGDQILGFGAGIGQAYLTKNM